MSRPITKGIWTRTRELLRSIYHLAKNRNLAGLESKLNQIFTLSIVQAHHRFNNSQIILICIQAFIQHRYIFYNTILKESLLDWWKILVSCMGLFILSQSLSTESITRWNYKTQKITSRMDGLQQGTTPSFLNQVLLQKKPTLETEVLTFLLRTCRVWDIFLKETFLQEHPIMRKILISLLTIESTLTVFLPFPRRLTFLIPRTMGLTTTTVWTIYLTKWATPQLSKSFQGTPTTNLTIRIVMGIQLAMSTTKRDTKIRQYEGFKQGVNSLKTQLSL